MIGLGSQHRRDDEDGGEDREYKDGVQHRGRRTSDGADLSVRKRCVDREESEAKTRLRYIYEDGDQRFCLCSVDHDTIKTTERSVLPAKRSS